MNIVILVTAFLALCTLSTEANGSPHTLVLLKSELSKAQHSLFLSDLKERGHRLEFRSRNSELGHGVNLLQFGERQFDNLLILDDSSVVNGATGYLSIVEFLNAGGNVLATTSRQSPDAMRKLAGRCGVSLMASKSEVLDHSHYYDVSPTASGSSAAFYASDGSALADDRSVVRITADSIATDIEGVFPKDRSESLSNGVLFAGVGMVLKAKNHLAFSLLNGNPTTVAHSGKSSLPEQGILASGKSLSLVSALQTRNNSRITFVGSAKALSNEYFVAGANSNSEFFAQVSEWTFGERSLLRAEAVTHMKIGDVTVNPNRYRITDEVEFNVTLREYQLACDCWVPYVANDVEFAFVRLDPFVRRLLTHAGDGQYTIQFTLPDIFGVYKLSVDYLRRGVGRVVVEELVSVRPFAHHEYDRFLLVAVPYYLSAFSMLGGFVLFTLVYLFAKRTPKHKTT